MHKWLECYLMYNPEANLNKCFSVSVESVSGEDVHFKTNGDRVWYQKKLHQPPGAPFGTPGYVRVAVEVANEMLASVNLGCVASHGDRNITVKVSKLGFVPPPERGTQCWLRKKY